jgi:hypothetical protein
MTLDSRSPEPPLWTVVTDATGMDWWHVRSPHGDDYWVRTDGEGDPESWTKIAGNYGPVTLKNERLP